MSFKNHIFESKKTFKFAFPMILTQLLQMSVATVDTIMAGYDSALTLAAVAQGAMLWQLTVLMIVGVCMSLSPLIAHSFSANNRQKVRFIFQQGVWLSIALGFFGLFIGYHSGYLMNLVGVDSEIIPIATRYIHIMAFSIPFIALYLSPRFLNEGTGNAKVLTYITASAIPINIVGNYILINGLLGFPKLGALGIAISSLLSIIFSTLIIWLYLYKSKRFKRYNLFTKFSKPNYSMQKEMLSLGVPISVSIILEVGMFAAVTLLMGKLGVEVAAANQIALNYVSITFMVPLGISMALTARIGMAMGRSNMSEARVIGISGMIIGAIFMSFSVLVIVLFADKISSLYTNDKDIVVLASSLLAIAGIFQIPDGIQVCSAGCLRGLKDTKIPMLYALIGYWAVGMTLAWYLGIYLGKGASGLWVGLIMGLSIAGFLGAYRFIKLTSISK